MSHLINLRDDGKQEKEERTNSRCFYLGASLAVEPASMFGVTRERGALAMACCPRQTVPYVATEGFRDFSQSER